MSVAEAPAMMPISIEPHSRANGFRRKRFAVVLDLIDRAIAEHGRCRILDVGGEAGYWRAMDDLLDGRPVTIDLVNLEAEQVDDPRMRSHKGDACDLSAFAAEGFHLVHANSVIEHVGDWTQMKAMARDVARIAPRYFVQSPYYWFPIEPHWRVPALHWFSDPVRAKILLALKPGFSNPQTFDEAMIEAQSARILDVQQLATLFPDARIQRERVFGLTKSIMAVRG
jgi:hypothetical protein